MVYTKVYQRCKGYDIRNTAFSWQKIQYLILIEMCFKYVNNYIIIRHY